MSNRKWHYSGDINIEHGGVFYTLENLKYGFFDAVSVQPCSDAGAQGNAWWITCGSVYVPTDNDKMLSALASVLDSNKRESESLHWLLTDECYAHILFQACFSYSGIEKDFDEVVQIGPKEDCRDYVEPTIQLKAGASLKHYVTKWRNRYG